MNDKIHQTGERLMKLRAMLRARQGKSGYEKNVTAIEAEIARLEGSTATGLVDQVGV